MSVNPGYGGQKFIGSSIRRIQELNKLKMEQNPSMTISVDGGINTENVFKVVRAGADMIVAGSAIFNSKDPLKTIKIMKGLL